MAANISGNMYTAPSAADNNHPAPTTGADAPYGRIDIDTTDQEHIATTAYVKGAYNSAIAAVNKVNDEKQAVLISAGTGVVQPYVWPQGEFEKAIMQTQDINGSILEYMAEDEALDDTLISTAAVAGILSVQRVNIYTTWDDDDTTLVPLAYDVMPE